MFNQTWLVSDLMRIIAIPALWIVIAIIFLLIWIACFRVQKDVDFILMNHNLGSALDSSGNMVFTTDIEKAMKGFGSVIKKVNNLSGLATLVSVFAAVFSTIVSIY